MTLPTLKDMTGIIKRDQLLPCDEGRRQYDIQEQVSKITSCIEAILSTNNPGAAGKFYTTDYVLVQADQLILRANIMKLSKLLGNGEVCLHLILCLLVNFQRSLIQRYN